jgi:hypothetical protein
VAWTGSNKRLRARTAAFVFLSLYRKRTPRLPKRERSWNRRTPSLAVSFAILRSERARAALRFFQSQELRERECDSIELLFEAHCEVTSVPHISIRLKHR